MQTKKSQLNQFAARTRLRINKKKIHVFRINNKCKNITLIGEQEQKEVEKYNYIVNIIRKARVSFMKLKQLLNSNVYTLRCLGF